MRIRSLKKARRSAQTGSQHMKLTLEGITAERKAYEAAGYSLPAFDQEAVKGNTLERPLWIHFGAGNIFRAYQANIVQNLLNRGSMDTGLIAAEGYDYEIIEKSLRPHDNLTILATLKADHTVDKTVVGSIMESLILDSHNPKEYNGYKVYGSDGAQITDALANGITEEIKKIQNIKDIKTTTKEKAEKQGLYNVIGKETDDSYIEELKKLTKNTEKEKNLKIVYTPLHGTGNNLVNRILKEQGVTNIYTVKEQEEPDPEFSTVKNPNPEDKKAFELALKLAEEKDADIVLATDPDADRLGVYAKDKNGKHDGTASLRIHIGKKKRKQRKTGKKHKRHNNNDHSINQNDTPHSGRIQNMFNGNLNRLQIHRRTDTFS